MFVLTAADPKFHLSMGVKKIIKYNDNFFFLVVFFIYYIFIIIL
jgi:hypothetical protein